jgi:hypothetical protein
MRQLPHADRCACKQECVASGGTVGATSEVNDATVPMPKASKLHLLPFAWAVIRADVWPP